MDCVTSSEYFQIKVSYEKYPWDVRSSYCIDYLFSIYFVFERNSSFERNYAGTFDIICGMVNNVIYLF